MLGGEYYPTEGGHLSTNTRLKLLYMPWAYLAAERNPPGYKTGVSAKAA